MDELAPGVAMRALSPDLSTPNPFLPPDVSVAMPPQTLDRGSARAADPATYRSAFALRRAFVVTLSIIMTMVAAREMYEVLSVSELTIAEALLLVLFVALFAWIAFSFASSLVGFVLLLSRTPSTPSTPSTLRIDTHGPLPALQARNVLLVPTYNESAQQIFARVQAIYESLQQTGQAAHFDLFVLSDTTNPDVWVEEEIELLDLRRRLNADRLFYRHRVKNTERKAGNIAEWVKRFGGGYDHMIVLDADSLMAGDTIVRLAGAMEANPSVGLIQTLPIIVNGRTLFARLQQFAGRVYGPMLAVGIAWWHGSESNYWGHNAIIRVVAFSHSAGLPVLRGHPPFGGHIMSHDFVEAALLRRAGWGVHMAPELGGSFEEGPPSVTDYAIRDRRWCQGNIQHLGVLPAGGLHWVSRLHLLTGIGSYLTAPLWLFFLLLGMMISLYAQFVPPDYFPSEYSLFPQWPAQDPIRAAWVFAATMAILLAPKFLAFVALLTRPAERRACGGAVRVFISLILETLVSGLIAPVMMLFQSRAIGQILAGRDAGWNVQRRDDGSVSWRELARQYGWHTALGVALAAAGYAISVPLFFWMTPVTVGLVLAIPVMAATSQAAIGRVARRLGLFLTPEESAPPHILTRGNELTAKPEAAHVSALRRLAHDHSLYQAHLSMLPMPVRIKGQVNVDLVVAREKITQADDLRELEQHLTPREVFAALADPETLGFLATRLFAKP